MRTILIMAAAIAVFTQTPASAQTAAGVVRAVEGSAQATRAGQVRTLHAADAVFSEDRLETAVGAKLAVTFADGTALTLGPDAEVTIDAYVYNPAQTEANTGALRITSGAVRVVAGALERSSAKSLKVETPVATIGIRGTDFFIEFDRRHLQVALFSGYEIVVTNPAGATTLRPGEGTDVWDTAMPSHALTWGTDRINRALALVTVTTATERPLFYARPIAAAESPGDALTHGAFKVDARYRYETVDQASKPQTAYASTLRLRAGYETLAWHGLFAGIEGEITREIGNARRNDGVNGRTALPLIADPDSEMLNQAYVGWTQTGDDGSAQSRVVVGRQRLSYDNERWIGPGAFRQNDQTFDAVSGETRLIPGVAFRYAYIDRVKRILGDNPGGSWDSDSHAFGVATNRLPFGVTTAYAYLLDLKPVPQFSSSTVGIRYEGLIDTAPLAFGLEAEVARQSDYAANPNRYRLTYALVRPLLRWNDHTTFYAGWENLGGNGIAAVQTPLATLHRQNGWADVFTVTPPNGLRDLHVRWLQDLPDVGPLKNGKLDLRYHAFAAARGGAQYGHEFDADINASVNGWVTVGLRYATYKAKTFDSDTEKLWLYVEAQY